MRVGVGVGEEGEGMNEAELHDIESFRLRLTLTWKRAGFVRIEIFKLQFHPRINEDNFFDGKFLKSSAIVLSSFKSEANRVT